MGYWLKHFADGTEIRGTDTDVAARIASWSRTPFTNMVGAEIEHNGFIIGIFGLGDYWQSDTYESTFLALNSVMTKRRIERKIENTDTHLRYIVRANEARVYFNQETVEGAKFVPILPPWRGQWFILEYDLNTRIARYYFRSDKI